MKGYGAIIYSTGVRSLKMLSLITFADYLHFLFDRFLVISRDFYSLRANNCSNYLCRVDDLDFVLQYVHQE